MLALQFQDENERTYAKVLQSARYIYGIPYRAAVLRAFEEDCALFVAAGFDVVRVKVWCLRTYVYVCLWLCFFTAGDVLVLLRDGSISLPRATGLNPNNLLALNPSP